MLIFNVSLVFPHCGAQKVRLIPQDFGGLEPVGLPIYLKGQRGVRQGLFDQPEKMVFIILSRQSEQNRFFDFFQSFFIINLLTFQVGHIKHIHHLVHLGGDLGKMRY